MNIFTYNWHEPFLHMLAKTGENFDVVEPEAGRGSIKKWDYRLRPLPENVDLISSDEGERRLAEGYYDLALCHNFKDIKAVAHHSIPVILLFHNKLTTELAIGKNTVTQEEYFSHVGDLLDRADELVFVSKSKRDDWGLAKGEVIAPGIDGAEFFGYTGEEQRVLCVASGLAQRGMMFGAEIIEQIHKGFDTSLLGHNPGSPDSRLAASFDALKEIYRNHRMYINITMSPFEDGYNLAMLEAMVTGAPVVSMAHPQSPITGGYDGFIADNIVEMEGHICALMEDMDLAYEIGALGRETVLKMFDMERFIVGWARAFQRAKLQFDLRGCTSGAPK